MRLHRSGWVVATALVAVGALTLAGCKGGGSDEPSKPGSPVTLKINFWGDFGLDELKAKYEADHPNVKIVAQLGRVQRPARGPAEEAGRRLRRAGHRRDRRGLHRPVPRPGRQVRQPARQGRRRVRGQVPALEVEAVAVGRRQDADRSRHRRRRPGHVLPHRPVQGGRPADRARRGLRAVADLGRVHRDRPEVHADDRSKKFVDTATNMFNPVLGQQPVGFYDESETAADGRRPEGRVRRHASRRSTPGLSANLASFQPSGTRASRRASSRCWPARRGCSATSRTPRPTPKGKWDIAAIPGGGGNWGGSFLTIPKQGKNVDEAYKLRRVAGPAGAADRDLQEGRQPAVAAGALQGPGDRSTSRTRSSATPRPARSSPTTAEGLKPQYLGKKNGPTRVAVENVINRVQQGQLKPPTAWAEAVKEAEKAAKA